MAYIDSLLNEDKEKKKTTQLQPSRSAIDQLLESGSLPGNKPASRVYQQKTQPQQEPEKPKSNVFQRLGQTFTENVKGAKKGLELFGKTVLGTQKFGQELIFGGKEPQTYEEAAQELNLPVQTYINDYVAPALQNREQTARELIDARNKLNDYVNEKYGSEIYGEATFGIKGRYVKRNISTGYITANDEKYKNLLYDVELLQQSLTKYDQFLEKEPSNRGALRQLWARFIEQPRSISFDADKFREYVASKEAQTLSKYENGEELTKEEMKYLLSYRANSYNALQEKGLGSMAADVVADMPKYMLMFWASRGVVSPITAPLEQAVLSSTAPAVLKTVSASLIRNSLTTALAANLNVPGISAQTAEYMLPTVDYEQLISASQQGEKVDILTYLKPGDTKMEAWKKAYVTNLIEYLSEDIGTYIDEATPFIKKAFVGKWLQNKLGGAAPTANFITDALREVHFNGLVSEVLEEEVAEFFQAPVEGRQYQAPLLTPEGTERLLVEIFGIAPFAGVGKVSQQVKTGIKKHQQTTGDKIDIPPKTQTEIKQEVKQTVQAQTQQATKTEQAFTERIKPYLPENLDQAIEILKSGQNLKEKTTTGEISYATGQAAEQINQGRYLQAYMDVINTATGKGSTLDNKGKIEAYKIGIDIIEAMKKDPQYKEYLQGVAFYEEAFRQNLDKLQLQESGKKQKKETPKKSQSITVYRGEGGFGQEVVARAKKLGATDIFGKGTYVTESKTVAEKFGKAKPQELKIAPSQILEITNQQEYETLVRNAIDKYGVEFDVDEAIPKYARDQGYKAIRGSLEFDELAGINIIAEDVVVKEKAKVKKETKEEAPKAKKKLTIEPGETLSEKPLVRRTDLINIAKNSEEFKSNPVLTVKEIKGQKTLSFKGEKVSFNILASALNLTPENLKAGQKIFVDLKALREGKGLQQVRVYKGGQVFADQGEYSTVQSAQKTVENIKAIEFPEMVRIARELTGDVPALKKYRSSLGIFYPKENGVIGLDLDIFKDPVLSSKVLAHEIGHLTDWLPDKTMARGNLIARIMTLNRQMKQNFGELNDKTLRSELKQMTQLWKPFDETLNKRYTKYRYSSKELYADAISVLYNDPALLKQTAPKFYQAWFDFIDRNPQVKRNFFAIQDLLNQGEEAILSQRQKDIRDMFEKGEDLYRTKRENYKNEKRSFLFKLKHELIDQNQATIDKFNEAKKQGKYIADELNPVYALEELNYIGGLNKNFVEQNVEPIYKRFYENDITWEDFGEVLFLDRVAKERGGTKFPEQFTEGLPKGIANPLGFDVETANKQLANLEKQLGEKRWVIIQEELPKFREAVTKVLEDGGKSGFYSEDLVKELKKNKAYATFQVLDYLDLSIPASIKQQVGTLKEISNPATATILKTMSMIRAIERNKIKQKVINFWKEQAPEEVKPANTQWNGRTQIPIESKERGEALFTVMEKGKFTGYYVDPYVASSFEYMGTGTANAVLNTIKLFNRKLFRPAFITFNLGFQSFNLMKDFTRYWKNTPNLSLYRTLVSYKNALPAAKARAWKLPNKTIQEMRNNKMLGITWNDIILGKNNQETEIDRIIRRYDALPLKKTKQNFIKNIAENVLTGIERTGNLIETIPKVAAYQELNGKLPSKELASFIRTSAGSPDFLRRGKGYGWYNEVFLFSNAIKEGIRADYNIAVTNPRTRVGYWWKTALVNFLPKTLMMAVLYGLFGDDLKKMLENVSEYDKTNYTIIPLGLDENNKTVYLRIPTDETGRLLGGLFWKMLRVATKKKPEFRDLSDILSYTGGQLPSPTPLLESLLAISQFAAGQNPYDFFRGREVIPEQEFKAGGINALKPYIIWQLQQLGAGIFWRTYYSTQAPETKTWVQKIVEAPILSNIIGRWIKVSDYGQKEINKEIIQGVEKITAQRLLNERKLINQAITDFKKQSDQGSSAQRKAESQLVKGLLEKYPGETASENRRKRTNTIKKFRIGLIKGEVDTNIDSLIYANTNEEKLQILNNMYDRLDKDEFDELTKLAVKNKIISASLMRRFRAQKNK